MASFNKVILVGNLVRDPERRYTPKGTAVTEFAIAVNRVYNTEAGERKEEVSYFDIVVWGKQAENCAQYLSKGRPALIEGRLQQDRWDDKETGQKRSKVRILAETVQFLGGRQGGAPGSPDFNEGPEDVGGPAPAPAPAPMRRPAPPAARPAMRPQPQAPASQEPPAPEGEKDDIPF